MKAATYSLIFCFILPVWVLGQQQGQLSQYMLNYYLINPAAGGTEDNVDIKASYRAQWVGLENAPKTFYASLHTPIGKIHANHQGKLRNKESASHQTLGGMVRGLTTGVLHQTGAYVSYGYHIPLAKRHFLSLGAMLGLVQYGLAGGNDVDASDQAMNVRTVYRPDGNLGAWLYGPHYFIGLSSLQIFGDVTRFNGENTIMNRHYYLTGGYAFQVGEHVKVIPSFLGKYSAHAYQMDVNAKVRYMDKLWMGLSYRYQDAYVVLIGAFIGKSLSVGYSYDYTVSNLNQFSAGSHEILLGYRFYKAEQVISPSDFW